MIKIKIINALAVIFLVVCMTQLSISSTQDIAKLGNNQDNQAVQNEIIESANDTVETTTAPAVEETTTVVEETTAEQTEPATQKPATTIAVTEPVAEQSVYVDEDMPVNNGFFTGEEFEMLCKVTYGEAGSLSKLQQAGVVWCILNRVDSEAYPNTIAKVITQPSQFYGYKASNPINPTTREVVNDVLARWIREKRGETDVGRVLPSEYMYFTGNGKENTFRLSSKTSSRAWDWSLPNPYGD